MTCKTPTVEVCCSNALRVSVSSRAFSIAMTACAGEILAERDLLVGERPYFLAVDRKGAEQVVALAQRTVR